MVNGIYKFKTLLWLLSLSIGLTGCVIQVEHRGGLTVLGTAVTTEYRTMDSSEKMSAQVITVTGTGAGAASTSIRTGFAVGYINETYANIYTVADREANKAWVEEIGASGSRRLGVGSPSKHFDPPPNSTRTYTLRGSRTGGLAVSVRGVASKLIAGYSDVLLFAGDAAQPPVALAFTADRRAVHFIPWPMSDTEENEDESDH